MRPVRGRFITFEGGEGTGKTTQLRALAHRLGDLGLKTVMTREPGGTSGAELVRELVLSGAAKPFGAEAEAVLFSAARIDHVDRRIRPALATGSWVLCDRFTDSTRVYQGLSGVEAPILNAMERISLDGVRPDLTIVLDLDPEIGRARAASRRGDDAADRFESEAAEIDEARRRAFKRLAKSDPKRCVVIDASLPSPEVSDLVWRTVVDRLHPARYV
ncbi:dTMP kinase [Amorphus orientalis]|nr:dTMP kinase [Amorphus orientalis]